MPLKLFSGHAMNIEPKNTEVCRAPHPTVRGSWPKASTLHEGSKFLLSYPRNTLYWRLLSRMAVFSVGLASKLFFKAWHKTNVVGLSNLEQGFLKAKQENRGILTIMNHVSVLDDPLVWGGTLPLSRLSNPDKMRWTLGAKDICFRNAFESIFFSLGQVLSVERFGRGPDQSAIDAAVTLLSRGRWVHIYPEGFVHQPYEPFEGTLRYFHWGVSRLVLESGPKAPIVLPIYGKGLQTVYPEDKVKRFLGYRSHEPITYVFGQPLGENLVEDLRSQWAQVASNARGNELMPKMKELRSHVARVARSAVLDTKRQFLESHCSDDDDRLSDAEFWKSQTEVKLKGRSMLQKRQKGGV